MRINKYIARATSLSRRKADQAILDGRVDINGRPAVIGDTVADTDLVELDHKRLELNNTITIAFNKPVGYVCSRNGQGSRTIYDLLPYDYQSLKLSGRLDKDSSGLIILSNDGELLQELTHPSKTEAKVYEVELDSVLSNEHKQQIETGEVELSDGVSKFIIKSSGANPKKWEIIMHEGRNRQIRRTFEQLRYRVIKLHRVSIGAYKLDGLAPGKTRSIY